MMFLPVSLVLSRNQAEGLRTIKDAFVDASHIQLWNKNRIKFDIFSVIAPAQNQFGWYVRDAHPRWNLTIVDAAGLK